MSIRLLFSIQHGHVFRKILRIGVHGTTMSGYLKEHAPWTFHVCYGSRDSADICISECRKRSCLPESARSSLHGEYPGELKDKRLNLSNDVFPGAIHQIQREFQNHLHIVLLDREVRVSVTDITGHTCQIYRGF